MIMKTAHEKTEELMNLKVMTEKQLSELKPIETDDPEHLAQVVRALTERQHDYGTSVYAMSHAALAAFYYVAGQLGVTGFQASCADLSILRHTRNLEGPFSLVIASEALFPQYDLHEKLDKFLKDSGPWLADEARKKIAADDKEKAEERRGAHPDVRAHWEKLVADSTVVVG